jgi:hypothetical protein
MIGTHRSAGPAMRPAISLIVGFAGIGAGGAHPAEIAVRMAMANGLARWGMKSGSLCIQRRLRNLVQRGCLVRARNLREELADQRGVHGQG